MINLTCQLLTDLCNTYPFKPVAFSLHTRMQYPFSNYGFVLGYTKDKICVSVVIDVPHITDDRAFQKKFITEIIRKPGYMIIMLHVAKAGEHSKHQLFYGASIDSLASASIGFKTMPVVHQKVQLTVCNLNNGSIATDDKHPSGVFLEAAKAYPFKALFTNPISRSELVEPIRRDTDLKLIKDGHSQTYTSKYIDIQCFIEEKRCYTSSVI